MRKSTLERFEKLEAKVANLEYARSDFMRYEWSPAKEKLRRIEALEKYLGVDFVLPPATVQTAYYIRHLPKEK